jgi:hypothetical protein
MKAALACKNAALAYELAAVAPEPELAATNAALACKNEALAYAAAEFAVPYAEPTNDEKSFDESKFEGFILMNGMVYLFYSGVISIQDNVSSFQYHAPVVGIATGASHKHVSSFNVQLAKGCGGINASRTESYVYPIPA